MPRLVDAFQQFFDLGTDQDGKAKTLPFGKIDFFISGSDTVRKTTFADSGETKANPNPVILDGDGRCPNVFGSGTYRAILRTSTGSQILQRDPVGGTDELVFGADWSGERVYGLSDVVRFNNEYYISQSNNNLNNNPSTDDGSNWAVIIFEYSSIVERQSAADYPSLRAKNSSSLIDGQVITVTDQGIGGDFVVKTGTVSDNGGTLIVFSDNSNRHAQRIYVGAVWAEWFGLSTSGSGASNRQAIIDALSVGAITRIGPGNFPLSGPVITIPPGKILSGTTEGNVQNPKTVLTRSEGDFNGFFETDVTLSSFTGITVGGFRLTGGSSSNWTDVQNRWAIQTHYPFSRIYSIQIEENENFFGNGIRVHNPNDITGMGGFSSEFENIRFVGTTSVPQDNGQVGFDIEFAGGQCLLSRCSVTRSDIGFWIRGGENIEMINCNADNIRCGDGTNRSKAAVVVGNPNTRVRVESLKWSGYIEGVGRGFVFYNTTAARVEGYLNAFRAFSKAVTPDDGFIYINNTAKNVSLSNADIETQYNGQNVIYSDSDYSLDSCWVFRNVTDTNGNPQTRNAGNVFGGVLPDRRNNTCFRLDNGESSTSITGASASGSEIQITAPGHPFLTGDYAWIEGVTGTVEANSRVWPVTFVDANNFVLDGSLFENSYVSGGNAWTLTTSLDAGQINRSVAYDPPSLASGVGTTTAVSAPGAKLGDYVFAAHSSDCIDVTITAYVSAADTVEVRLFNGASTARDIAAGTLFVQVTRPVTQV